MNPAQIKEALEKLEALKASQKPKAPAAPTTLPNIAALMAARKAELVPPPAPVPQQTGLISYNEKQQAFIDTASTQSCVLIGAAGTGKTTATGGLIKQLANDTTYPPLFSDGHKHLTTGTPGIICCAFTRRATNNIRRVMPENMKSNCITIHKLLEFRPEFYEEFDAETGKAKTKRRFPPNRHRGNPLPSTIHTIIIEESSMVGTDLHDQLMDAIRHPCRMIYLGDIQQLPPVFGPAILGYKLLELPVIELTEVYRQALDSPIISLAHRILRGEPLSLDKTKGTAQPINVPSKLTLHPWKKSLSEELANLMTASFFKQAFASGAYDPEEDIILCPYNVSFGCNEINKHIATFLARHRNAPVYEIISGFQKKYLAVGDKVLFDKEDATVLSINRNMRYIGKPPQKESTRMDYWGSGTDGATASLTHEDIDAMFSSAAIDERQNQASHCVTLQLHDRDEEITLDTAGEVNSLDHGYAITVHKAQGSEWRRVFFVSNTKHARMLTRELVYTAITRAREHLYVICDHDLFEKVVDRQVIKGNTLEAKAQYFMGKYKEQN